MTLGANNLENISKTLEAEVVPKGFEAYPFRIGWYNETVGEKFRLKYVDDTLAFLIISTPDMFEKCVLPFVQSQECNFQLDPVDSCIRREMQNLKGKFDTELEILHDFEMDHNRRPRILVQSAGHISGAAYFYQRHDVTDEPWDVTKKIYGVSVHPRYGGWFALRCVIVFKTISCPDLKRTEPIDIVNTNEKRIELLEKYNESWQDWTFRDIVPVEKRYSERQKEYFSTLPSNRKELIQKWKEEDGQDKPESLQGQGSGIIHHGLVSDCF